MLDVVFGKETWQRTSHTHIFFLWFSLLFDRLLQMLSGPPLDLVAWINLLFHRMGSATKITVKRTIVQLFSFLSFHSRSNFSPHSCCLCWCCVISICPFSFHHQCCDHFKRWCNNHEPARYSTSCCANPHWNCKISRCWGCNFENVTFHFIRKLM